MAIDVTSRVHIDRPRSEVGAFLEEPANDHRWIRALARPAEILSSGAYGEGTRVRRVAKMAGRTIDYTTEIVGYAPHEEVVMTTVGGGLPMRVSYALSDSAARVRALAALVQVAAKLLEVGELAERLAELEATLRPRGPLRAVGGKR